MNEKSDFRVLIVGGGIAGLTLAKCLESLGIDFLLLEKRGEIAPEVGASIGFNSNGNRINDQLGVYDKILAQIEPLGLARIWGPGGKLLVESQAFPLFKAR